MGGFNLYPCGLLPLGGPGRGLELGLGQLGGVLWRELVVELVSDVSVWDVEVLGDGGVGVCGVVAILECEGGRGVGERVSGGWLG